MDSKGAEEQFYALDMINLEFQKLGAKQKTEGLDPLDIKLLEILVKSKVEILTKIKPVGIKQQQRLEQEASDFLVETLLSDLGEEQKLKGLLEIKKDETDRKLPRIASNTRVDGGVKKTKSRAKKS